MLIDCLVICALAQIVLPFEDVLDYDAFAVRLPESAAERVLPLLRELSPRAVRRKQQASHPLRSAAPAVLIYPCAFSLDALPRVVLLTLVCCWCCCYQALDSVRRHFVYSPGPPFDPEDAFGLILGELRRRARAAMLGRFRAHHHPVASSSPSRTVDDPADSDVEADDEAAAANAVHWQRRPSGGR
jgi:hypothetical protein